MSCELNLRATPALLGAAPRRIPKFAKAQAVAGGTVSWLVVSPAGCQADAKAIQLQPE